MESLKEMYKMFTEEGKNGLYIILTHLLRLWEIANDLRMSTLIGKILMKLITRAKVIMK